MTMFDDNFWWKFFMKIFYDNFLWQLLMTIFDDNFWWQFLMTFFDQNVWWQFLMTIFDNFWQFRQFWQFLIIFYNWDNWDNFEKTVLETCDIETLIAFLTIENLNSDNYSYLTINWDTGQHSQFLRCLLQLLWKYHHYCHNNSSQNR